MLKQIFNNKTVATLDLGATVADEAVISALLEGQIDTYTSKSTGGVEIAYPVTPSPLVFTVGKKYPNKVYKSATVRISHAKALQTSTDLLAVTVGAFDENLVSSTKCDYCTTQYSK